MRGLVKTTSSNVLGSGKITGIKWVEPMFKDRSSDLLDMVVWKILIFNGNVIIMCLACIFFRVFSLMRNLDFQLV